MLILVSLINKALAEDVTEVLLPEVINSQDAESYQRIFELQEGGHWDKANKIIMGLHDQILMGHVLAQRYLHPNKYRSKYKELKDWMARFADHPDANRLYKLALKRKPFLNFFTVRNHSFLFS